MKEHLSRHQRLVIVPSGPLNLLPFTVLPHGEDILGASHVVSVLPATALLPRLAGERAETGEVLVVGDPSFAAETCLPRLPGTRMETLSGAKQHGTVPLLGGSLAAGTPWCPWPTPTTSMPACTTAAWMSSIPAISPGRRRPSSTPRSSPPGSTAATSPEAQLTSGNPTPAPE